MSKDNFKEKSRGESLISDNGNIKVLLDILAGRENLPRDTIIKIVRKSIIDSYCQGENLDAILDFEFTDKLLINRVYKIVENVNNSSQEVKYGDSIINDGIINGDKLYIPLDTKKFTLSLNRDISYRLNNYIEKLRKNSEKKGNFKYYIVELIISSSSKIDRNRLYRGRIIRDNFRFQKRDKSNNIVAYWKKEEWDDRKKPPFFGQNFYFAIEKDIIPDGSGGSVMVTRQSDLFIKKVLELQVPEISNGHIIIEHIIRVPKLINKVIVSSKVIGIDPIGACIGLNSDRKKEITGLIFPERIDIIAKDDNLDEKLKKSVDYRRKKMLLDLLLPIRALSIIEDNDKIVVFIPEEKISSISKDAEYNKRNTELLNKVSEYINKKIILKSADDLLKKNSSLFLWNGNIKIESLKSPKRKLW